MGIFQENNVQGNSTIIDPMTSRDDGGQDIQDLSTIVEDGGQDIQDQSTIVESVDEIHRQLSKFVNV